MACLINWVFSASIKDEKWYAHEVSDTTMLPIAVVFVRLINKAKLIYGLFLKII
jgi:hypothetical protein